MRKGTFSVQKAGANSTAHNSREHPPKYLIGLADGTHNFYEQIQSDNDFILEAQQIYKDKVGQKMQKKQVENLVQETVLTLQEHQDENDVKRLFEKLYDEYGGHTLLELSIHRDEGHFEKDGIAYYPTKNILRRESDWYVQSDPDTNVFDVKVNIDEFEKVYNYHAHAKFSMFDKELGKTARMQKKDMSSRIKLVSEELGLKYAPDEATRHIKKSVGQVKNEHHAKAKAQVQEQYNYRDYQKQISELDTDNAELKKSLHKLNSQVKNDNASVDDLQNQLINARKTILELNTTIDTQKSDLSVLEQDMSELRAKNKEVFAEGKKYYQMHKENKAEETKLMEEAEKTLDQSFKDKYSFKELFSGIVEALKNAWNEIKELKAENEALKTHLNQKVAQNLTKEEKIVPDASKRLSAREIYEQKLAERGLSEKKSPLQQLQDMKRNEIDVNSLFKSKETSEAKKEEEPQKKKGWFR